jgi:hypothetical protein
MSNDRLPASIPLPREWRDQTIQRIAGDPGAMAYAQRADAARSAMRETMLAMDAKLEAFVDALIKEAEAQRPHVINSDGIRKLAEKHGLL